MTLLNTVMFSALLSILGKGHTKYTVWLMAFIIFIAAPNTYQYPWHERLSLFLTCKNKTVIVKVRFTTVPQDITSQKNRMYKFYSKPYNMGAY